MPCVRPPKRLPACLPADSNFPIHLAAACPAGEAVPDAGDALVCGRSLLQQPAAARQLLGYCPQARCAAALPALH